MMIGSIENESLQQAFDCALQNNITKAIDLLQKIKGTSTELKTKDHLLSLCITRRDYIHPSLYREIKPLFETKQYKQMIKAFNQVDSKSVRELQILGCLYLLCAHPDLACNIFQEALAIDRSNAQSIEYLLFALQAEKERTTMDLLKSKLLEFFIR